MLALKELLHNLKDRDWDVNPVYKIDVNEARRIIEGIEAVNKWIPTNPKLINNKNGEQEYVYGGVLPANQEDVLIITRLGFIEKVRFYDDAYDTFFAGYGDYKGDVEAWMPLPQAYKAESEE